MNGTVFAGTFDGQDNTLSNMVVANNASGYLGLFSVNGGTIKNLTVTGTVSTSQSTPGGIVGKNLGTIENCIADIHIRAIACDYAGGIAADNAGTIKNCMNLGDIDGIVKVGQQTYASSGYVGGIVGHVENLGYHDTVLNARPIIDGCVNRGAVSGSKYVGGIAGGSFVSTGYGTTVTAGADFTNCANHGAVKSQENAGGIVGYISADDSNLTAMYLKNCYNTADVYGIDAVGGIVGKASLSELTIENCYNSGDITAASGADVGYIAGSTKAAITNSYYLLKDVTSEMRAVGYGSGDNHARPVNGAYLDSAEFAGKLGSAYKYVSAYPVLIIES
jgi:hypothetical protein